MGLGPKNGGWVKNRVKTGDSLFNLAADQWVMIFIFVFDFDVSDDVSD